MERKLQFSVTLQIRAQLKCRFLPVISLPKNLKLKAMVKCGTKCCRIKADHPGGEPDGYTL
jgi:hypothetical protein